MNISTKGQYGVMAMAELALRHGAGPVPLKSVAERQGLSEHYLEQLFGALRKAGLVRSVRGAQGGYLLAREPEEITVGQILRVLEGPIALTPCSAEGNDDPAVLCGSGERCLTRHVWIRIRDAIASAIDGITLAHICEEARNRDDSLMFYI